MIYDFDEVIERKGTSCLKFDGVKEHFHTEDVIPLWVADMDFKTAKPIIDACVKKANEGIFGYTKRPESYFDAIYNWQLKRNGWEFDKNLISWSYGVVASLAAIVRLFTKENDNILILTPVYPRFYAVPETSNRNIIESKLVENEGKWDIDFDDFEKKVKQVKMFILCNPHNPLGKVWSREELTKMIEICVKNNVLIVSDEIHSDLIFHGKKHIVAASISESYAKNIITCTSCTKTFNLAGLQSSAVIFPNSNMKEKFDKYWEDLDIDSNNSFSVVAMEAAYRYGQPWLEQVLEYISANFDYIKDYCDKYIKKIKPNLPDATYLVWLDCRQLNMDNDALNEFMVKEAGLGLNPGYTFCRDLSGYMRLNAACPRKRLQKALQQLKEAVDRL